MLPSDSRGAFRHANGHARRATQEALNEMSGSKRPAEAGIDAEPVAKKAKKAKKENKEKKEKKEKKAKKEKKDKKDKKDKKEKKLEDAAAAPAPAATTTAPADNGTAKEDDGLAEFPPVESFEAAGFPPAVLKACSGFKKPTLIQSRTWGPCMAGRDVVGIAATGSGKVRNAMRARAPEPVRRARARLRLGPRRVRVRAPRDEKLFVHRWGSCSPSKRPAGGSWPLAGQPITQPMICCSTPMGRARRAARTCRSAHARSHRPREGRAADGRRSSLPRA